MAPRYPWVAMVIEVSMFEYARSLPIYEHLSELTEAIWSEDRALVQALPGAGKTTCLPLALRETLIAGESRPRFTSFSHDGWLLSWLHTDARR